MDYVWASGLIVVNTVWLALVAVGLPGIWLMVASASLVTWWLWDPTGQAPAMFSLVTLAAVIGLAVLSEVVEFFAGVAGSSKAGGSRRGSVGALLGGMAGAVVGTVAIPIPVLGSLLGACGGACVGAWALELSGGRTMDAAVKSGAGAGMGRLLGTVGKLAIGAVVWAVIAVAAFWP